MVYNSTFLTSAVVGAGTGRGWPHSVSLGDCEKSCLVDHLCTYIMGAQCCVAQLLRGSLSSQHNQACPVLHQFTEEWEMSVERQRDHGASGRHTDTETAAHGLQFLPWAQPTGLSCLFRFPGRTLDTTRTQRIEKMAARMAQVPPVRGQS